MGGAIFIFPRGVRKSVSCFGPMFSIFPKIDKSRQKMTQSAAAAAAASSFFMEAVDRDPATVYQAVREGNVDIVREYLEAGGDANMCNPDTGRTLLHAASRQVCTML